jgi:hypothetical protein
VTDTFEVKAKDTSLLETSHLVEELQLSAESESLVPVLIGTQVAYFHSFDGGYDRETNTDIVNCIHEVQGAESPPNKTYADSIEIHAGDWFFNLDVDGTRVFDWYPGDDFVLSIRVSDYMIGEHSFSEALTTDIDKREQEFNSNRER